MNLKLLILNFLILTAMSACAQYTSFDQMATEMGKHDVELIKNEALKQKIGQGEKIYLLDAREKSEYDISHLKNAKYIGFDNFAPESVAKIPKNSTVVVYCSVGYRSGKIGVRLKNMGYTNVYNLYGGIFDWVNDGNPVYDNNEKITPKIHSYNKDWGQWLKKGEKVF